MYIRVNSTIELLESSAVNLVYTFEIELFLIILPLIYVFSIKSWKIMKNSVKYEVWDSINILIFIISLN